MLKKFNSIEHVEDRQKELLNAVNNPVLIGLEESWQQLSFDYGCLDDETPVIDRFNLRNTASTPIECLVYFVESGYYPPPEILLAIVDGFRAYFESEGSVELEEIFFGKSKRGLGNFSKRKKINQKYFLFHGLYVIGACNKAKLSNTTTPSLESIAEKWFAHIDDPLGPTAAEDIESFLRGYRRWRKNYKRTEMPY